jgi:2-haloacid dehalogenase
MQRIKALAFDYYGTIADKRALSGLIDRYHPGMGTALARHWFSTSQRYCFQMGMMERYAPWDELTRRALDFACADLGVAIAPALVDELIEADATLPVYPDVPAALARLAAKYRLYVLSMGSAWMIKRSQQSAGIARHFAGIITTQGAAIYKPRKEAYALAAEISQLEPEGIGFVSGNSFDVIGSKNAGLLTIWVRRHNQPLDPLGFAPDIVVTDLIEMADRLDEVRCR